MECTVTSKKAELFEDSKRILTVEYDFGTSVEDAIEKFGAQSVFNHFIASAKLSINSLVRPMLEAVTETGTEETGDLEKSVTYSDEQVHAAVASYKIPDKTGRQVDNVAKAMDALAKSTPEKKAEILALLNEA